jgi:hypothetical protein
MADNARPTFFVLVAASWFGCLVFIACAYLGIAVLARGERPAMPAKTTIVNRVKTTAKPLTHIPPQW